MCNTIRMELYKMFRMQAFWVITLITILMVAVSASFLVSDIEENTTSEVTLVDGPSSSQADEESDDATSLQFGINESSEGMDANNLQVLQVFMAHLSSGMFALFNVIFLIIFVTADQKNGYIKNIGGQVKRRYRLIVAKWVAAAVYVLVFDAIMGLFFLYFYLNQWQPPPQEEQQLGSQPPPCSGSSPVRVAVMMLNTEFTKLLKFCSATYKSDASLLVLIASPFAFICSLKAPCSSMEMPPAFIFASKS